MEGVIFDRLAKLHEIKEGTGVIYKRSFMLHASPEQPAAGAGSRLKRPVGRELTRKLLLEVLSKVMKRRS